MRQSESIAKLAAALVKAHAEVENATKNAANPHFKSRYADLAEIINTYKPVFARHGLAVMQLPGLEDGHATVETMLLHESGEWIAGTSGAPLQKADPQGVGSAITYLRRYSLAAIAGMAQEDDDGNAASNGSTPRQAQRPAPAHDAPPASDDMISCPACAGPMWDNRLNKKNPKGPDLKCKSKECDHAIWLTSWRDDLLAEIAAAHDVEAIDAHERTRAETAVGSLVPAKMDTVQKWLTELAQGAGA